MNLGLAPPSTDQLKIRSTWLHNTPDGQKTLHVFRIYELLATEDIDKVECLGQHLLCLRVDYTHNRVMRRLHQLCLLNDNAHFAIVTAVDLFKCLDHQLVELCVPVKIMDLRNKLVC